MARMRISACLLALLSAPVFTATPKLTEDAFRETMKISPNVRMAYRDLACQPVQLCRRSSRRIGELRKRRQYHAEFPDPRDRPQSLLAIDDFRVDDPGHFHILSRFE